ncbi:unnamed protein product [Malus baccata var. baccata]
MKPLLEPSRACSSCSCLKTTPFGIWICSSTNKDRSQLSISWIQPPDFSWPNFQFLDVIPAAAKYYTGEIIQENCLRGANDTSNDQCSARDQKLEECSSLIFGIGIACSAESPTDQKDISGVASELHSIRDNLPA